MRVEDLNRDQLIELKQQYYIETKNPDPSYGELAEIDSLVTDYEVYQYYHGYDFSPDDFASSAGRDDWWVKLGIDGSLNGPRNGIADDLCQIAEWIRRGNNGGFFYKGIHWEITE